MGGTCDADAREILPCIKLARARMLSGTAVYCRQQHYGCPWEEENHGASVGASRNDDPAALDNLQLHLPRDTQPHDSCNEALRP